MKPITETIGVQIDQLYELHLIAETAARYLDPSDPTSKSEARLIRIARSFSGMIESSNQMKEINNEEGPGTLGGALGTVGYRSNLGVREIQAFTELIESLPVKTLMDVVTRGTAEELKDELARNLEESTNTQIDWGFKHTGDMTDPEG